MKAKNMMDTVLRPKHKQLVLLLALAWSAPLMTSPSFAQDKPPVMVVEPSKAALSTTKANQAQETDLLSLYRQAALSDPTFTSARYSFLAGKEKTWQGLSVLLPQVNATGNETKNDLYRQSPALGSTDLKSRGWNVRLTQPLFSWDKWEQFGQGNLSAAIAEAQFAAAEQDLVLRVTEAYFNVLNAQDTLNLNRNKKALISEQLEQAKRNFEVGTSTITDTHEAQSRFDLVVAQELAAEADLLIKRSAL